MIISCKNLYFFEIIFINKQCGSYITVSTHLFSFITKHQNCIIHLQQLHRPSAMKGIFHEKTLFTRYLRFTKQKSFNCLTFVVFINKLPSVFKDIVKGIVFPSNLLKQQGQEMSIHSYIIWPFFLFFLENPQSSGFKLS